MKNKPNILLIDDDKAAQSSLSLILEDDYTIFSAGSGQRGLEIVAKEDINLVFLDIGLPDMDGVEVLEEIKRKDKHIEVIMATAVSALKTAIQTIKKGAFDFITKPFDVDEVLVVAQRAIENRQLLKEVVYLRSEIPKVAFNDIVGKSKKLLDVFKIIRKVTQNDATVLVTGESGTGKEMVSKAIHYNSSRKDKPFVAVNCAAIPDNLLESELFGHEKGAFTNALTTKLGKFELADGGTILLDEISSMKKEMQAKILRIIQESEVERVGGVKLVKVDVRVIATTNVNLREAVKKGEFREDLYYRLNVVPIILPPLRERKEDIPLLISYFVDIFNNKYNTEVKIFSKEAIQALKDYSWPGNVRELKNIIDRIVALADKEEILIDDIPLEIFMDDLATGCLDDDGGKTLKEVMRLYEKRHILAVMKMFKGHQTKAAEYLGVHRNSLIDKIKKLKINSNDYIL